MAVGHGNRSCIVVLHDNSVSSENILCGTNILPNHDFAYLQAAAGKSLCISTKFPAPSPDEISVHVSVATQFGFENRMTAGLQLIEDVDHATATHVELLFRDQHLSRADMWRIGAQFDGSVLYRGQKLKYLGSTTADVEAIYISGEEVESAIISDPQTKLIFRSASARYTILIQISKEMIESWNGSDLMYERLVSGFLPELFQRWSYLKVRHQVSLVLFGRHQAPIQHKICDKDDQSRPGDFFHVIASDIPGGDWRDILRKLKLVLNNAKLPRRVSLAANGNMLEAIHAAAIDFADDSVDQHLSSTGTSIIAITAGSGLFNAEHGLLKRTTQLLMGNSIGVDIISLSPKPLHPVPLFQYKLKDWEYALPHWVDISYWVPPSVESQTSWQLTDYFENVSGVAIPSLQKDKSIKYTSMSSLMDGFDREVFSPDTPIAPKTSNFNEETAKGSHLERNTTLRATEASNTDLNTVPTAPSSSTVLDVEKGTNISASTTIPFNQKAKQESLPTHSLIQTGRKISLGPRGLAPSKGVASITVSAQYARYEKEISYAQAFATNESPSGIAKQIRESLARKPSQQSLASYTPSEPPQTSKPINIQNDGAAETNDDVDPASVIERTVAGQIERNGTSNSGSLSATPNGKRGSLPLPGLNALEDDSGSVSPWLTLLNPCNPRRSNMRVASEYRKWQNIFPRPVSSGAFKWDSICSPAALPLMTEYRISASALEKHFDKKIRRLVATTSQFPSRDSAHHIMLDLINMRLTAGFQIVPARKPGNHKNSSANIDRVLLSLGSSYHELRCLSDAEVQVVEYERSYDSTNILLDSQDSSTKYNASLCAIVAGKPKQVEMQLDCNRSVPDWSSLDDQSVNPTALADAPGVTKVRYVLLPVAISRIEQAPARLRELSDEERRIDGIQRLTQLWQRNRYFSDEEQRHLASMVKSKASTTDRDPNPLAIEYQTRDLSAVVRTLGPNVTGQVINSETKAPLFSESDLYHTSNFDIVKLVKHMQEPPPSGVEVKDRRWFTRLHLKCFRGDEMTNWLLRVFKDLETRDDAVDLGNQLMNRDIFTHVRGKHGFRDGNYFYQIRSAYRTTEYPDTTGLFAKGIGRSVPSTPITDLRQSPTIRPDRGESEMSSKDTPTPTLAPADRKEVLLCQMMQYNVDSGKKSSQLEIVNLYYDRFHNPENCYHIQLDWTSTTSKLIRESVARWTSLVESHGLKMVQVPLSEAFELHEQHPFDQTISIELAARPPDIILETPQLDPTSLSPRSTEDVEGYHKALLRTMDFVLDFEAARNFSNKLDVRYSWGAPSAVYTQFIHRSGLLLAQISNNADSDFLLVPNRLALHAAPTMGKKSEAVYVEEIVEEFKSFCYDEERLKQFFKEVNKPKISVASPLANSSPADSDVPPMQLPPHVMHRGHR